MNRRPLRFAILCVVLVAGVGGRRVRDPDRVGVASPHPGARRAGRAVVDDHPRDHHELDDDHEPDQHHDDDVAPPCARGGDADAGTDGRAATGGTGAAPQTTPALDHVPTTDKVIFLGIDDGLVRDPALLTLLRKERIPLTLFLVREPRRTAPTSSVRCRRSARRSRTTRSRTRS